MEQTDKREAADRVSVMLVLPGRLVEVARVHAAKSGLTRNAVVLEAMREYTPSLRQEPARCRE
jgi:hypothetical protein